MTLDVDPPAAPDLTNRELPDRFDPDEEFDSLADLRREELETALREGAWTEAFNEWAEYTDLSAPEYRLLADHGLLDQLDFYWDPVDERVQFELPPIPAAVTDREGLETRARTELTDLADTVVEMLEDAYVDWGTEGAAEEVWSDETFDDETPPND